MIQAFEVYNNQVIGCSIDKVDEIVKNLSKTKKLKNIKSKI